MKQSTIPLEEVQHIAKLAHLPITPEQTMELAKQISITVHYVSQLQSLRTEQVVETSQVTGLTNVFREDEIDNSRMLSQEEALANASHVYNGFFVVPAVFSET